MPPWWRHGWPTSRTKRQHAELELGETVSADKLTKTQVRALVLSLRDMVATLRNADPKLKDEVYAELGVEVTYEPETSHFGKLNCGKVVRNLACRRGDLNPYALAGTSPSS